MLMAVLLLAGCASRPTVAPAPAALPLLPPASLGASRSAEQILHAAYGEAESTLQCIVEIDAQRIRVTGLTALGQRVFALEHDGTTLHAERAPFAPDQLRPQAILADIQLAYWPLAALQNAAPAGLRVVEPRPGLRRLLRNGRIATEVHYADADPWAGRLWLLSLEHGYSLDIRSRPLADSAP